MACPREGQNHGMSELWSHLGITWMQVLGVVIAATALYLVYVVLLRWWGQRVGMGTSALSIALATVMGSLMARAMLGDAPTLLGGLVAVTTLIALESGFGLMRSRLTRRHPKRRRSRARARVVVVHGEVRRAELQAARLSERDLAVRLRTLGVTRYDELALVVAGGPRQHHHPA